jgi:hypothetical protein
VPMRRDRGLRGLRELRGVGWVWPLSNPCVAPRVRQALRARDFEMTSPLCACSGVGGQ